MSGNRDVDPDIHTETEEVRNNTVTMISPMDQTQTQLTPTLPGLRSSTVSIVGFLSAISL